VLVGKCLFDLTLKSPSLGSVCWPIRRPELIQYLVESLLAADIPFLFATASRFTQLDQDLRTKVEAGGNGMIVPWVPQNTVLQHPAVRFFLVRHFSTGWTSPINLGKDVHAEDDTSSFQTHCGSGSVVEAITAEMPIVAWPYVGDQTIWARQRESSHRAAGNGYVYIRFILPISDPSPWSCLSVPGGRS
jgi:hypothetical protein